MPKPLREAKMYKIKKEKINCYNLKNKDGFTLVELLVVLVIAGFLLAAIGATFQSQNKSYVVQEEVTEMQQNLRAAMLIVSRDVMLAGYGVAPDQAFTIGNITYNYDAIANGDLPETLQTNNDPLRTNADGLIMRRADSPLQIVRIYNGAAANFSVCSPSGFSVGDILTIMPASINTNYQTVEVTQIQATSAFPCPSACVSTQCDKINFSPGLSPYNNPGGLGDGEWEGGIVARFVDIAYFIDPNSPDLMRSVNGSNGQPVAENIEDLQIVYQDFNGVWSTNPANIEDIRSVRINILARTNKYIDKQFSGTRPAIEDHAAAAGQDNFRRRLLTKVIMVRNMGL